MKVTASPKLNPLSGAILVLVPAERLSAPARLVPEKTLAREIAAAAKSAAFGAAGDEKLALLIKGRPVLLWGLGKEKELRPGALRCSLRRALLHEHFAASTQIQVLPHSADDDTARAITEAAIIGAYAWDKYLSDKNAKARRAKTIVKIIGARPALINETKTVCAGLTLTRDLVNENAGITDSRFLEKAIRSTVRGHRAADMKVLDEKQMRSLGMNLFLAVNRGSENPPRLVIVRYKGGKPGEKFTAMVGKGITFDSGGLNIKTSGKIEDMKLDMAGAAALIGVLKNTLAFKPKKNLLFAFCLAENAVGPAAYRPGDVFTGYAGKSVEVANTDAEGRLVLADANAYISKNYPVGALINIATLTGAVLVALGQDHTGLMCDDDAMAERMLACGRATDDPAWRMPYYPELAKYIKSRIADLRNIAAPRGHAGTITAGAFLRQFVDEKIKWAHMDIAGTAFINQAEHKYFGVGATGAGVRLLTAFVRGAKK